MPLLFMVETILGLSEEENVPGMKQVVNLHETFPNRLVELELQLHRSFRWYEETEERSGTDSPTDEMDFSALIALEIDAQRKFVGRKRLTTAAGQVVKWLLEMARHKQERFPFLVGVALLKWTDHFGHKTYRAGDLGSDEECLDLLSAFEAGIVLDYVEQRSKPSVERLRP
jgi:hypothetical protein